MDQYWLTPLRDRVEAAYRERKPVMGATDDDFGGHASALLSAKVAVLQDILEIIESTGQDYLPTRVVSFVLGVEL